MYTHSLAVLIMAACHSACIHACPPSSKCRRLIIGIDPPFGRNFVQARLFTMCLRPSESNPAPNLRPSCFTEAPGPERPGPESRSMLSQSVSPPVPWSQELITRAQIKRISAATTYQSFCIEPHPMHLRLVLCVKHTSRRLYVMKKLIASTPTAQREGET